MAWSLLTSQPRQRNHIIAVDLGSRTTKAVHLQRKDAGFDLLHFALADAPVYEKGLSPDVLGEHLKTIVQALGNKTKFLTLALGVNDSMLRTAEMPLVPLSDMRQMLRLNSKAYFQQDFPDCAFDCYILPLPAGKDATEMLKSNQKCRVLVGGAKKQHIEALQGAAKIAGVVADQIAPGVAGMASAFELAQPESFANEVVALVDLGFRNSTINILLKGELSLSRVVAIGGDKLTSGLAETMGISYPEAEGIKIGMLEEVQSNVLPLLTPLSRELRASIDFFEHQYDRTVSRAFLCGGSARSRFIVESLQTELVVPCELWNPLGFLKLNLPEETAAEAQQIAPQLGVAIGAGVAALS